MFREHGGAAGSVDAVPVAARKSPLIWFSRGGRRARILRLSKMLRSAQQVADGGWFMRSVLFVALGMVAVVAAGLFLTRWFAAHFLIGAIAFGAQAYDPAQI